MKKTLSVVLCLSMLFFSLAVVGVAEGETHPVNCDCSVCVASRGESKDPSDYSFTQGETDTTFKRDGIDDFISEKFGDELGEAGKDAEQKMSVIEKFLERVREFCALLARLAGELGEPLSKLFNRA